MAETGSSLIALYAGYNAAMTEINGIITNKLIRLSIDAAG
jgi:hypothetical protein